VVLRLASADPLASPALARELSERYLVWDAFVAGSRRVDLHPLVLPADVHAQAVAAAEGVTRAVSHVAERAHQDPGERERYAFDDEVVELATASHAAGDRSALVRVDLLWGSDGRFRACEINADCPGGHNEATGLPRLARLAGHAADRDPTNVLNALASRLAVLADGRAVGLLHATAYAEDLQVCALVQRALQARGVRAILAPPTAPREVDGRLCIRGEPVGALYRFFPTEGMVGQRNVSAIARAIARGEVRSMSSFASMYAQSKLAMARAWSDAPSLPEAMGRPLRDHLPVTLDAADCPRAALLADRAGWVLKRALGRVGDEVFVGTLWSVEDWAAIVERVMLLREAGDPWIAQRFIEQSPIATPWGPRLVTLGAYVLDGTFVGYFARLTTESHVSHDALAVPVFAEAS
jgi:glutathionylspermidine synthase